MSAESLRSEIKSHLSTHHVIKSADQVYYKDKQVYTQLQTKHNQPTIGGKSKDKKKGRDGGNQQSDPQNKLQQSIEAAKKAVDEALQGHGSGAISSSGEVEALRQDVAQLKAENKKLNTEVAEIRKMLQQLLVNNTTQAPSKAPEPTKKGNDDDFDLFGSDDDEDKETEEQKRIREERLAAYAAKKAKKPGPIAKSSVILDVKPWDDETNLEDMEKQVRSIQMDGLLWGAAKQIPIGYGIKKLQIISTVEDEKVSVDDLIEQIQGFEDYVQSVDVVAFNKI